MTATSATSLRAALLSQGFVRAPFARDAALPRVTVSRNAWGTTGNLADVLTAWAGQIQSEELRDFKCVIPSIRMDPRDGALTRDVGAGLAYTPRGFSTLVGLTLNGVAKENNTANVVRVEVPCDARSIVWDSFKARSKRDVKAPVILRTFVDRITGTRAVRAAVSPRHALGAYDDSTMILALAEVLPADSRAGFNRTPDATHGTVVLPNPTATGCGTIHTAIHFSNSETGCESLSFSAGAHLSVTDTELRITTAAGHQAEELEREIELAADDVRTTRRHTAPARLGEAQKIAIAKSRLEKDLKVVLDFTKQIPAMWEKALASFPEGLTAANFEGMDAEQRAAVMMDKLEELGAVKNAEDRALVGAVIKSEERLGRIPQGSAAHLAACFSIAAHLSSTYEEAKRLQAVSGDWLVNGWNR